MINFDSDFYKKRKNQLCLFLKYIKQHKKLSLTQEFKKFIRDPTFDSEFFKAENNFYDNSMFTESLKKTETYKGTFMGYLGNVSNYFKKDEELICSINEKELKKIERFYRTCLDNIQNLKNKMVIVF